MQCPVPHFTAVLSIFSSPANLAWCSGFAFLYGWLCRNLFQAQPDTAPCLVHADDHDRKDVPNGDHVQGMLYMPVAQLGNMDKACLLEADIHKHAVGSHGLHDALIMLANFNASPNLGLLCLTLFHDILGNVYYWLFYHMSSGSAPHWFTFEYYLKLEFWSSLSSERLGNLLLFLLFGVLYPLFDQKATWKRTLLTGAGISVAIELLQPIFGRIFGINDIALNMIGVLVSTTIFFTLRRITGSRA